MNYKKSLHDVKIVSSTVGTLSYEFSQETIDVFYNAIVHFGLSKTISRELWRETCKKIF